MTDSTPETPSPKPTTKKPRISLERALSDMIGQVVMMPLFRQVYQMYHPTTITAFEDLVIEKVGEAYGMEVSRNSVRWWMKECGIQAQRQTSLNIPVSLQQQEIQPEPPQPPPPPPPPAWPPSYPRQQRAPGELPPPSEMPVMPGVPIPMGRPGGGLPQPGPQPPILG